MAKSARDFNSPETQIAYGLGANIGELGQMFGMERRDVTRKLARAGLRPSGTRDGTPVFSIKEACRYLVLPSDQVVAQVMSMHHYQLPPMLRKEYYQAVKLRQEILKAREDTWSTMRVVSYLGETFQQLRMALLLLPDTVARQTQLSSEQRELLNRAIDGVLSDARERLVSHFSAKTPSDDHGDGFQDYPDFFPTDAPARGEEDDSDSV